jgi:hypothetical protein
VLSRAEDLPPSAAFRAVTPAAQNALRRALKLAHKVLDDPDHPKASDKVVSNYDPDARSGKHGDFFDGYLADVTTAKMGGASGPQRAVSKHAPTWHNKSDTLRRADTDKPIPTFLR